jgi:hypothetical protein
MAGDLGDDDNLYTTWGDGGGFGGNNTLGRVSVGLGRIEGMVNNLQPSNIWGGYNSVVPANFEGKSNGILSVNGTLYMLVTQEGFFLNGDILKSTDHGLNWTRNSTNSYLFAEADGAFSGMTFLQFGRDYHGARDNFVYVYSQDKRASKPRTQIAMFRVPKNQILNKSLYEYFAGLDTSGQPTWSSNITNRKAVFFDSAGIGFGVRVTFVPSLNRYILTKWNDVDSSWGIYDAPEPWGPWTTVKEYAHGEWMDSTIKFGFTFPTKWMSSDGTNFVMVFSGLDSYDSWNSIEGSFVTAPHSRNSISPIINYTILSDR